MTKRKRGGRPFFQWLFSPYGALATDKDDLAENLGIFCSVCGERRSRIVPCSCSVIAQVKEEGMIEARVPEPAEWWQAENYAWHKTEKKQYGQVEGFRFRY